MVDRPEHSFLAAANRLGRVYVAAWLGLLAAVALIMPAQAGGYDVDGAELAATLCARCHDIVGSGPSPEPDAPPFRVIVTRWPPEFLAEALAEGITVRHHEDAVMPAFQLDPDDINALIAYLEGLTHDPPD